MSGGPTSTSVGLHLLPSELLHSILLSLPLPDLLRLRSVSRSLLSLISTPHFHQNYQTTPQPWLFLFIKRPPHRSLLRGFHPPSNRCFTFPVISSLLIKSFPKQIQDLYFLAADKDFFLFASNSLRQLIALNLTSNSLHIIPPSPLGPRGTSSWRRSGLKLISDSIHFRFLFAELHHNRPMLFEYRSDTDTWRSMEAQEGPPPLTRGGIYLNVVQMGNESVVMCADASGPVVCRPRFNGEHVEGNNRLHVYGDGNMAVVRSMGVIMGGGARMRVVVGVEIWRLSLDGREWEMVCGVPAELIESRIRKEYGVMMGCLEERVGVIRVVLMSNCNGVWDLTWIEYHRGKGEWEWVPVPDCGTQGLNMAGIAISSSFIGFRP